jgi:hypothetical protein
MKISIPIFICSCAFFASVSAMAANVPFMDCGDGDYLLSSCEEGYVCVNGSPPVNQQVTYLNKEKDGAAMIVTLPYTMNLMVQWEKLPNRQRLYIYDYPDGVHPRLTEKVDCHWLKKNKN